MSPKVLKLTNYRKSRPKSGLGGGGLCRWPQLTGVAAALPTKRKAHYPQLIIDARFPTNFCNQICVTKITSAIVDCLPQCTTKTFAQAQRTSATFGGNIVEGVNCLAHRKHDGSPLTKIRCLGSSDRPIDGNQGNHREWSETVVEVFTSLIPQRIKQSASLVTACGFGWKVDGPRGETILNPKKTSYRKVRSVSFSPVPIIIKDSRKCGTDI